MTYKYNIPSGIDTLHRSEADRLYHTPGSALAAGDIVQPGGSILGFVDNAIAASARGNLATAKSGVRLAAAASATTFSVGDEVWWDASAEKAVAPNLAVGDGDIPLGICCEAKVSGANCVAFIPFDITSRYNAINPFVYEFDCDGDNGDTDEHILIPANQNVYGLLYRGCWGIVTEQMAGSSEDQGVVTIEDSDDNAIATLTASDAAADAVNDVIVGTSDVFSATTGDAAKVVAAGKAVQGFVSQQTSGGTPAGKIKVYLDVVPLI